MIGMYRRTQGPNPDLRAYVLGRSRINVPMPAPFLPGCHLFVFPDVFAFPAPTKGFVLLGWPKDVRFLGFTFYWQGVAFEKFPNRNDFMIWMSDVCKVTITGV